MQLRRGYPSPAELGAWEASPGGLMVIQRENWLWPQPCAFSAVWTLDVRCPNKWGGGQCTAGLGVAKAGATVPVVAARMLFVVCCRYLYYLIKFAEPVFATLLPAACAQRNSMRTAQYVPVFRLLWRRFWVCTNRVGKISRGGVDQRE